MATTELIITTHECLRCGHLWPSKIQGRLPLICPKCRSVDWKTDKKLVPKSELARVKAVLAKLKERKQQEARS